MFYRCSSERPKPMVVSDREDDPRGDIVAQTITQPVSRQLIGAQERELSYIARELHDNICQRLAMLSLRIERVSKAWAAGQTHVGQQLEQLWRQCSDLTGDVQALSHELHPSILDNVGLVAAVTSFCREVSEHSGAVVQCTVTDVPDSLPREVSLSLFRVVQEALHNATKYSGEKYFEVHLQGTLGQVELEVCDCGAGFDVTSKKNAAGLGLVSMRERVHLLDGTIHIDSKPNAGTRIHVRVPLATESKPLTAAAANPSWKGEATWPV
jgi:signal transduction histidine kinase